MKILMQEGEQASDLQFSGADLALTGRIVDDRGQAGVDFAAGRSAGTVVMGYDCINFRISLDQQDLDADDVETALAPYVNSSIILETSTLGFVEIFLTCRALHNLGQRKLSLLYVEPREYSRPHRSKLLHRRDFALSEQTPDYRAIPGATMLLRESDRGIFFLGYEARRLDRVLEDFQMINPRSCTLAFGVPAFTPGWEMNAFANNIRVIRERRLSGGVLFCGAENPDATVVVLERLYSALEPHERLFVAPIGTKPAGIGAALFTATHPGVGILYDHPVRRAGRSREVSRWHLFDVTF